MVLRPYGELTPEGWCEQVLARIDDSVTDHCQTDGLACPPPGRDRVAREELDAASVG